MALTDHTTDHSLELFISSLLRASECIKNTFVLESVSKILCGLMTTVEWQNNYVNSLLREFKRSGSQSDRLAYLAAQKVYQTIIRKKKMGYKHEKVRRLASFDKDPRSFWRELRQVPGRKKCFVSKGIMDCD